MIKILSTEDILQIHEILVRDFACTGDPIYPPGVKDLGLLESAVARQLVGYGSAEKYKSSVEKAATLTYGVCNNHPFFNGNKRTALVAMIAHLDRNHITIAGTKQKLLYEMIIALASHRIVQFADPYSAKSGRPTADEEVAALSSWIEGRTKKPKRGEKQVTYRQLRKILSRHGFELRTPSSGRGNRRDLIKLEKRTAGVLRRREKTIEVRIGTVGYRDEGTEVAIGDLKKIREMCRLREEDGIDSDAFYDSEAVIETFVNRYRNILKRLARK